MKISKIATNYLVLGILEEYEDYYDYSRDKFIIINTVGQWRERQRDRIEALKYFEQDDSFNFLDYTDDSIGFFKFSEEHYPQIKKWIEKKEMFFIDAGEDEMKKLIPIPDLLERPGIQIKKDGTAVVNAYDRYSSTEILSVRFPLKGIVK